MGRSQRPDHSELMGVVRLAGECRDLAHDSDLWHRHCLEGLRAMLGGSVAMGGEGIWLRPGHPVCLRQLICVGFAPDTEEGFRRFIDKGNGLTHNPLFRAMSAEPDRLITFRRSQLVMDEQWYSAPAVMELHRLTGADDALQTALQVDRDGTANLLMFQRICGDKPFSERERQLLHAFHLEIAPLIGTVLATTDTPGLCGLPPRQRQTLMLLARGCSHKQVALELGIRVTTARDYIDQLKLQFGVQTTPELICTYLGRNRTPARDNSQ